MANSGYTQATLDRALSAVAEYGTMTKAAASLGMNYNTFVSQVREARRRQENPPETPQDNKPLLDIIEKLRDELEITKRSLADAVRPKFTIRQDHYSKSESIRVVVIGDAHDSPLIPDKSRFEWIGKYINASKPDVVVQIGDFASIDSLNSHEENHTALGRKKPSFAEDMVSFNEALDAMASSLNYKPELHCCLGNHERRIWTFENQHPELSQDMQFRLFEVFNRFGWSVSPYGLITYYGGVGYVHAALNKLGKTFGGKNAETTIANESVHDLVVGHSHVERKWIAPKIGANHHIVIDNVGCALPNGHIEDYAKHATNGWAWGIVEQTLRNGHIADRSWISMERLCEQYG